ncbi:aldehyde dehydrogenase (NAD+) [Aneurinibacillus thermoaerophilus]|uniref:Aldehyde dehydrogenase (NAD+) n=1 Tax=Aneurinibacillus thermoaerophilus TaxID=143495 RepID=A0A1G8BL68_ANETH|nr:aldehyde dehydrogenase (NAD+) [Aneurinibacillus thermoaerophilus]
MKTKSLIESKNFIGGEWVSIDGKETIVYSPSNLQEEVGILCYSSAKHLLEAEKSAKEGFKIWSKMTGIERGNYLYKMAEALENSLEELAVLASREMGKPIGEMRGEVVRGIHLLRYYAAEGTRSNGDIIPSSDKHVIQFSKRVPLGVVGIITPWNFPVAIPIWKIAPALICGNSVIWKPAENATLSAIKLTEIFQQANLPSGVLNLIVGKGKEVGNTLLETTDIHAVSFTGSSTIGKQVASICAKRNIKYQTEMGGKNAAVILHDANIEKTIPMILSGAFRSAGQKCTATSRIIVEESVYPIFMKSFNEAVSLLKAKDPLLPDSYLGPVASKHQYETVSSYVKMAEEEAEIIAQGSIESDNEGYFIQPLVVAGVDTQHKLVQEEIFGPVTTVLVAKNYDEAIQLCNETVYGLSASIFTTDLSKAHRFLEEAEAGMVRVNQETAGVEYQAPFGGMKQSSSHSREQGQSALDFYSQIKTCAIKYHF